MEYRIEELLVLVKELVDQYTSKESTSVTYEVAQQLMSAVLYCIEESKNGVSDYESEHSQVTDQNLQSAREAYDLGYQMVTKKIRKANEIYMDIMEDFKDYGNIAYYDTVVKGIPEFFKWYDPRLNPQNHILTLDYPVLDNLQDLQGIDIIYPYLKYIQLEQKFLKKLPEEYVKEILISHYNEYEELFINLSGIVLRKVLVSMLINTNLGKSKFDSSDYEKIINIVNDSNNEILSANLHHHLDILIKNIYKEDQELFSYLKNEIPELTTDLIFAVNHNVVNNFI